MQLSQMSKNYLLNKSNKINKDDLNKSAYYFNNKELFDIFNSIEDPLKKGPFRIYQEISYSCTGQCFYCMNKGLNYNEKLTPIDDLLNFYKKIVENDGEIRLKITGGEPLQPNNLPRTMALVNYAFDHPKNFTSIQINSNGNWPIPKEWSNHPQLAFWFSLDGPAEYIEPITKIPNLYNNLINNLNYCIDNNIDFKIRSVMTKENEKYIPFLKDISEKYQKIVSLNWVLPVGGGKDKYEIEEYIDIINKVEKFRIDNLTNKYFNARGIVGICSRAVNPDHMRFMITPSGKIGLCPFLGTVYQKENLSIYNFDFDNISLLKKQIALEIKDKTCGFPQGFLTFWSQLNNEQKSRLKYYIDLKENDPYPSLKEYYNLTEE